MKTFTLTKKTKFDLVPGDILTFKNGRKPFIFKRLEPCDGHCIQINCNHGIVVSSRNDYHTLLCPNDYTNGVSFWEELKDEGVWRGQR